MFNERRMEEAQEIITSYYWGHKDIIEFVPPILGGLLNHCRLEEITPIIMELLHDNPLVERISKIYEQGHTLWSALEDKTNHKEEMPV
jgi:hypothetical protein